MTSGWTTQAQESQHRGRNTETKQKGRKQRHNAEMRQSTRVRQKIQQSMSYTLRLHGAGDDTAKNCSGTSEYQEMTRKSQVPR